MYSIVNNELYVGHWALCSSNAPFPAPVGLSFARNRKRLIATICHIFIFTHSLLLLLLLLSYALPRPACIVNAWRHADYSTNSSVLSLYRFCFPQHSLPLSAQPATTDFLSASSHAWQLTTSGFSHNKKKRLIQPIDNSSKKCTIIRKLKCFGFNWLVARFRVHYL